MKRVVLLVALAANLIALLSAFGLWLEIWQSQAVVFLVVEAVFAVFVGIPVFVHHRRKGLPTGAAVVATVDTVLDFMAGWV